MSSTISGTLSPGAELLTSGKLLPPGGSQSEIGTATPDQGIKKSGAIAPLQTSSVVSGSITSPDGDTVELSAEAMQMLQQMGDSGYHGAGSSQPTQVFSAAAAYERVDYVG